MPSKKTAASRTTSPSTAKAAARDSARKPSHPDAPGGDALARRDAAVQKLASGMPNNANKALEHGAANAIKPPVGQTVKPASDAVSASTLSERNASAKTGAPTTPETPGLPGALDGVRTRADGQPMTTDQGTPIADNQNSLKAGLRGPVLLEDFILREKITHFDHERIPERVVHARGSAAHGYFESYKSHRQLTRATPFAEAGKRTPVFVRFSTVAGERGSVDTARDIRGFAVKFYTDEGNWDLVGNNIPVFFIQDAMKFPDLIHAVKPEPHNAMPQAASAHDTFWDFVSLMPESTHVLMWVMSDRGIPRSYRMMQGFGVHTYRFVNAGGASQFVKFHWTPKLGTHSLVWDEAVKIAGADSDFHRRDLWEAIEAGEYPEWELGVQVFSEADAEKFSFDVLDATKLVPEELVPVQPLGRMVLDRNPDNFFAETEQVAFCVAHVVPGIDFSNDPLLAGRIHSYNDTQITRLGGPNFHEIPINGPIVPVHNNQRDGIHRQAIPRGRVAYEPNSLGGGCPFQAGVKGFVSFPQPENGDKLRGKPEKFAEHYAQATLYWQSLTAWEKNHLAGAFRFELSKVAVPAIRERMVASLVNVSPDLAKAVADGLGIAVAKALPKAIARAPKPEVTQSKTLSLTAYPGAGGIRTRKVAMLVADGVAGKPLLALHRMLVDEGAVPSLIAPRLGAVATSDGVALEASATLENAPPVLFDALVLPDGDAGVKRLAALGQTQEFVTNHYRHCKAMLVLGASKALLDRAGISTKQSANQSANDAGVVVAAGGDSSAAKRFMQALAAHRHPARETDPPRV